MLAKIQNVLNMNPSDEQGRKLHAYALRLTESQRFWSAKNNLYVVGHETASSYVVCEQIISRTRTLVRCHRNGCMRESLVENIDKIEDIDPLKKKMCLHHTSAERLTSYCLCIVTRDVDIMDTIYTH